jgi:hypothetical protein
MYQFSLEGLTPFRSEPYPFTELQAQWLKALKSGQYAQGRGIMRNHDDTYCCLGVFCELAGWKATKAPLESGYRFTNPEEEVPTQYAMEFLPYPLERLGMFRTDIGRFANRVRFPGVGYGVQVEQPISFNEGHASLASMNDVRMLSNGENVPPRAFTFPEIAAYIEFDPWNVFEGPANAL